MMRNTVMVLAVAGLAGLAWPTDAQMVRGDQREMAPRGGQMERIDGSARPGAVSIMVEGALRASERLQLDAAQLAALEAIRDRSRTLNDDLRDRMVELRREIRDGDITRNQVRERMSAIAVERRESSEPLRLELEQVLTEEQQEQLRRGMRATVVRRMRANGGEQGRAQRQRPAMRGLSGPAARRGEAVQRGVRPMREGPMRGMMGGRLDRTGRDAFPAPRPGTPRSRTPR